MIATITVTGFSGPYDGQPHGATGTAIGINGESLTGLLTFGETFTNVPGGTVHWTFAGDAHYAPASGTAPIAITGRALVVTTNNKSRSHNAPNPRSTARSPELSPGTASR